MGTSPGLSARSKRAIGERQHDDPAPVGSLVDGDFGSYYNFLNQQRLPGAEHSSFVAWFEGHNEAVVIGPKFAPGTQSSTPTDPKQFFA